MTTTTYLGVVHPWLCDSIGHLNVRHYVGMFDDANTQFLASLGWGPRSIGSTTHGWADVRGEIDYLAEVVAGSLVEICSELSALGKKSLTVESEMRGRASGELHARMRSILVHFDLGTRKAIPLPPELQRQT